MSIERIIADIRRRPGVELCEVDALDCRFCVCFVRVRPLEAIAFCAETREAAVTRLLEYI